VPYFLANMFQAYSQALQSYPWHILESSAQFRPKLQILQFLKLAKRSLVVYFLM